MQLNKYIDHTLLKPEATHADIHRVCEEAKAYQTASVCVNPIFASYVAQELKGTGIKTCCVVGFPLGATPSVMKAAEAKLCVQNGAEEIDMVIPVGFAREGDWDYVEKDIAAVVQAVEGKAIVKVIIETCLLTEEQKVQACRCAQRAGADFVKTSTGFSTAGATAEDVALMRKTVGPQMGVKAAGGIRSRQAAEAMIAAGATRIGASSSKAIIEG
ncbi:MAG: deoxyribose-phosphate aldolase [Clostridia bacterium]|nr:deoxyribose-phosphate aldolase [Clostridia bacterium]